jgi:hypothetical protein
MTEKDKNNTGSQPLEELLSLRGKPFADWKEERKYLREKWGFQGRSVAPGNLKIDNSETDLEKKEQKE